MRILLLLLALPVLIVACALLAMWLPLPHPFPPSMSQARNQLAAIATGIVGAVYLLGLAIYLVTGFLRAGRALDLALVRVGLAPESYMIFGRRYQGPVQGRQVVVTSLPARGISPAQLDIHVGAGVGLRMAMGARRPLLDCRDCPRLRVDQTGWTDLHVYAEDAQTAQRLLADPEFGEAARRLLVEGEGNREVYLQPDGVWLRAHPRASQQRLGLAGADVERWLADLLALADAATGR